MHLPASYGFLLYKLEASKCPFAATNSNDHPTVLVLVWQTIFVFKNTKDHKNVKNLSIKSFITGRNRKNQGIKKEMKPSKYKTS